MMEQIWTNLSAEQNSLQSPAWHKNILKSRQAQLDNQETQFSDLDVIKQNISNKIK